LNTIKNTKIISTNNTKIISTNNKKSQCDSQLCSDINILNNKNICMPSQKDIDRNIAENEKLDLILTEMEEELKLEINQVCQIDQNKIKLAAIFNKQNEKKSSSNTINNEPREEKSDNNKNIIKILIKKHNNRHNLNSKSKKDIHSLDFDKSIKKTKPTNKQIENPPQIKSSGVSSYDKYKSYNTAFKSVKTSLKHIIKDPARIKEFNDIVFNVNRIVIHTYNFLKLYVLHYFDRHNTIPVIDNNFMFLIMKTVSIKDNKKGTPSEANKPIIKNLQTFHNEHYKPLMKEEKPLIYSNINQILKYEAEKILTGYENHFQEHFEDIVNRFVNIFFDEDKKDRKGTEKVKKRLFRSELKKIKNSIMYTDSVIKCDDPTYSSIVDIVNDMLKGVTINKSLAYMTQSNPLNLLPIAIRMSRYGEILLKSRRILHNNISESEKILLELIKDEKLKEKLLKKYIKPVPKGKIINCFPLRASVIPKYIDIDMTHIVEYFLEGKKNYRGHLVEKSAEIWGTVFKTNLSVFRKRGYIFNRRISTDGIGCTLLFIREDLYQKQKKSFVYKIKKPKDYKEDIYVDDLTKKQKADIIKNKKVIGADPGKNTIIKCTDGDIKTVIKNNGKEYKKVNTMSFTNRENRHILKCKKNNDIIEKDKKGTIIKGRTVKERESSLSEYNAATCNVINFKEFLNKKNAENIYLIEYYEKEMYRKMRLERYGNQQKMKERLINKFATKFGTKEEVVIMMGDWSETKQKKHNDPSKGKGIRRIFKEYGYELYLVDEYRTSCRLYETGEELINVRNEHELLGSKIYNKVENMNEPCKEIKEMIEETGIRPIIINRDVNGSLNIRLKGMKILKGEEIPEYMRRGNKINMG